MEKRLLVAVLLMTAVILGTNLLFPPPEQETEPDAPETEEPAAAVEPAEQPEGRTQPEVPPAVTDVEEEAADTVEVVSGLYRYTFSTRGAALVGAELLRHRSFFNDGGPAQLIPRESEGLLANRLILGQDTVDLRTASFRADTESLNLSDGEPGELRFVLDQPDGLQAEIVYRFSPDTYVIDVQGSIGGLGDVGFLLAPEFGPGLQPNDNPGAQGAWFTRGGGMSLVTRARGGGVQTAGLDGVGPQSLVNGPLSWAGVRDRYFLTALIADPAQPFGGVVARERPAEAMTWQANGETETELLPRADLFATLSVGPGGEYRYRAYIGPQEHGRLAAVGQDLQQVNPYGYRWLQPVIRPIAAVILGVLDFLHDNLGLAYGWVLMLFGVMMRIVLWPLNAKAMRAQLRNMGVQPLMQEIREKHKDDPQRMQQEMMKLYKEHGFNPLAGCLPMLIPFPVLITLFFVFEGTIAFRGESFLWLPDLSLRDPLFLLPLFLVISMFSLQFISQRLSRMEINPQLKFMMYGMPLVVGFLFFMLPSGLNLYYATTNVATIPQQVLIARERRKAQEEVERKRAAEKKSGKEEREPAGAGAGGANRAERRRARRSK